MKFPLSLKRNSFSKNTYITNCQTSQLFIKVKKGALFLGKRKKTFYQRVSIHSEVSNILQVCPPAKGNFIKIGFT